MRWSLQLDGRYPRLVRVGSRFAVARELKKDVSVTVPSETGATVMETLVGSDDDDFVTDVLEAEGGFYVHGGSGKYPSSASAEGRILATGGWHADELKDSHVMLLGEVCSEP